MTRPWFEIDRQGLTEIAKRRGMAFIITEPIQNAWDESTRRVEVTLQGVPRSARVDLTVTDDSPDGFADLTDSHTLFRQSRKLADPEKRGRFNLGEKLLLATAESARVTSTTGSVIFGPKGRTRGRKKTDRGSVLQARLKMTREELDEAISFAARLIPPDGIETVVNGATIPQRKAITTAERTLDTETLGAEGGFRYTRRKTTLTIFEPLDGEPPSLYEMGIPIDEIACPWHVDIGQKVPLSMDRGSVQYGYVKAVQNHVAAIMSAHLSEAEARKPWVSESLARMDDDEAVCEIVTKRFGQAVSFDPSNQEANKLALDAGYTVVKGPHLSREAWQTVRRANALKPAGQVFGREMKTSPQGKPAVSPCDWTPAMRSFAAYALAFYSHIFGDEESPIDVRFYELNNRAEAFIGDGILGINLNHMRGVVEKGDQLETDLLLIHEFAHVKGGGDHLSDRYHDECCRIGAKLRAPWFLQDLSDF